MTSVLAGLCLFLTLGLYLGTKWLYKKKRAFYLSPVLICPLLIIACLLVFQIPYPSYQEGTEILSYLLQPATVAFAIPMYKYWGLLKKYGMVMIGGILLGSLLSLIISELFSIAMQLSEPIANSVLPHFMTTPFAMYIAKQIGGVESLAAALVIITGLVGALFAQPVIRLARLKTPLAKGLMLGVAAHGIGTGKAFELGEVEGTVSSLAMIITAGLGLFLTPFFLSTIDTLFN
jgi:predicted murein hydrolase (TIGR00659 family)